MMSVTIRPATVADAPAIAQVHYLALEFYHDFYAAFFARHPREILALGIENALKEQPQKHVFLVAVSDGTGDVVGFIRYNVVEAQTGAATEQNNETSEKLERKQVKKDEEKETKEESPSLFATKEHMKGLWERFNKRQEEIDTCYEGVLRERKHIYINHLMILPTYQRQGIGRSLLENVLQWGDAEGLPAYLVSTAESRKLYVKMGFESLGVWTIDNGYWAREVARVESELGIVGDGDRLVERYDGAKEVEDCMVRWPKSA